MSAITVSDTVSNMDSSSRIKYFAIKYFTHNAIVRLCLVLGVVLSIAHGAQVTDVVAADVAAGKDAKIQLSVAEQDALRKRLQDSLKIAEVFSLKPSALPGFYDAQISEGGNVLIREDGKYFIAGDLWEVQSAGLVNHSEQHRAQWRKTQLDSVTKRDMLVFSPQTKAKTHVHVFTDVDCGYCRRLHQEVPLLNRYGIEVRYLAFPRAGVGSPTYNKMVTAWCAGDSRRQLTQLKNGKEIPIKLCVDNPVSKQYELGKRLGVRGTPAIFTESGVLLPGYLPPDELAKRVGVR